MWNMFLSSPVSYCRPFIDIKKLDAEEIGLYTDAAKNLQGSGMGAVCQNDWMFYAWNVEFLQQADPSIAYLELVAVTTTILTWAEHLKNK